MSDPRREGSARRGFTLLEVLVAVALLGVVVSVLARSAIEGMSYEGDATRRMRASLIADRALFGVEAGLALGPPVAAHQESEDEEYRVVLDVQPIELGPGGLDALLPPRQQEEAAAAGEKPTPSVALALFRVFVQVSWVEGLRELSVTRSSFAYDASAAAEALGSAEEEEAAEQKNRPPTPAPEEGGEP